MSLVCHVAVVARASAFGFCRGVCARARAARCDGSRHRAFSLVTLPSRRRPQMLSKSVGGVPGGPFAVGRFICARATSDPPDAAAATAVAETEALVAEAGEKIRTLKASGGTNTDDAVVAGVAELKALKAKLSELQGVVDVPKTQTNPEKQSKQGHSYRRAYCHTHSSNPRSNSNLWRHGGLKRSCRQAASKSPSDRCH